MVHNPLVTLWKHLWIICVDEEQHAWEKYLLDKNSWIIWKNSATAFENIYMKELGDCFTFLQELILLELLWLGLMIALFSHILRKKLFFKTTNFKNYINFIYHNSLYI